jgi:hypothetical protein
VRGQARSPLPNKSRWDSTLISFLRTSRHSLALGSGAVDIFVFTNSNQGNVLASAPNPAGPGNTDTDYTPLWQVNLVSWVKGPPTVLTSQADITTAAHNGFVSIQKTPIIVECSVIFTPRGGLLPLATVREDSAEEADRR